MTAVANVGQELDEAREALDPGPDEPAATVATYLAFRRDEADGDRETLLRLAARAEFQPEPEPAVAQWLVQHGVPVS